MKFEYTQILYIKHVTESRNETLTSTSQCECDQGREREGKRSPIYSNTAPVCMEKVNFITIIG